MKLPVCASVAVLILLSCFLGEGRAAGTTLSLEGLSDGTALTTQYGGVSFHGNGVIQTAGVSLDQSQFPPHSGVNVVGSTGFFAIFNPLVTQVSGFFTYSEPLSIAAFDPQGEPIAYVSSRFTNNEAASGQSRSSPNELIQITGQAIYLVEFETYPGAYFTVDDLEFTPSVLSTTAPEPNAFGLLVSGMCTLSAALLWRRRSPDQAV